MIFWGHWRVSAQCVGILYWPWETSISYRAFIRGVNVFTSVFKLFEKSWAPIIFSRASSVCVSFFLFYFVASWRRLKSIFDTASSLSRSLYIYTVLSHIRRRHQYTVGVVLIGSHLIQLFLYYCFFVFSNPSTLSILWSVSFAAIW